MIIPASLLNVFKRCHFGLSLRSRLFGSYVLVVVVTVLTTLLVHLVGVQRNMLNRIRKDAEVIAVDARTLLQQRVRLGETEHLSRDLLSLRYSTHHEILFLDLRISSQGQESAFRLTPEQIRGLAHGIAVRGKSDPSGKSPGPFVALPLVDNLGQSLGAVVVYHAQPNFFQYLLRAAQSVFGSLLIALITASVAAFFLARNLTLPIHRMESVVQEFAHGRLSVRTELVRSDELGFLAKAFDQMAEDLEKNLETRHRLLSDVSHELSTPISTIQATLEAVLDGVLPEKEQRQYLQSLLDQSMHLSHIVSDITELARFESGDMSLTTSPFSAQRPVHQAVDAARVLAERKGVILKTSLPEDEIIVTGDVWRITQVMKNLVMNAVQHNPSGTTVWATLKTSVHSVAFEVTDYGPRIAECDLVRLSERFYKADRSRTRDDSRSGLGLAIVAQILHQHASKLHVVQNEISKTFSFTLSRTESQV